MNNILMCIGYIFTLLCTRYDPVISILYSDISTCLCLYIWFKISCELFPLYMLRNSIQMQNYLDAHM